MPDGPLPDPDTPAPVRFLPEYDNIALSHDDRTRVIDRTYEAADWLRGSILVDGFVRGTWRHDVLRGDAVLQIRLGAVAPAEREAVEAEALRLMEFLAADAAARDIRWGVLRDGA